MTDNQTALHAGCVDAHDTDAGCVQGHVEAGQANAEHRAAGDSTGCAAPPTDSPNGTPAAPPQTVREFERALRGLGFSRLQAEAIGRRGFSGASAQALPEHEPEPDAHEQLRGALMRLARTLKETP